MNKAYNGEDDRVDWALEVDEKIKKHTANADFIHWLSGKVIDKIIDISELWVVLTKASEISLDDGNIFVFNHYSRIETVIIVNIVHQLTGKEVYFIIDSCIYKNKWLNWYFKLIGGIPVDDPDKYRKFSLALLDGCVVVCFPQGSMDKKQIGLPIKKGSAILAKTVAETGMDVHIIPGKITFSPINDSKNWLSRLLKLGYYMTIESNFLLRPTMMKIDFGDAIIIEANENPLPLDDALLKKYKVVDVVTDISDYLLN